jgi:hypothetical protein
MKRHEHASPTRQHSQIQQNARNQSVCTTGEALLRSHSALSDPKARVARTSQRREFLPCGVGSDLLLDAALDYQHKSHSISAGPHESQRPGPTDRRFGNLTVVSEILRSGSDTICPLVGDRGAARRDPATDWWWTNCSQNELQQPLRRAGYKHPCEPFRRPHRARLHTQ